MTNTLVPGRHVPTAAERVAILLPAPMAERWDYMADDDAIFTVLASLYERDETGRKLTTVDVVAVRDRVDSSAPVHIVRRRGLNMTYVTEHRTVGAAMDAALSGLGWGPLHYGPTITGDVNI